MKVTGIIQNSERAHETMTTEWGSFRTKEDRHPSPIIFIFDLKHQLLLVVSLTCSIKLFSNVTFLFFKPSFLSFIYLYIYLIYIYIYIYMYVCVLFYTRLFLS
jgi:hypothetical protein